MSFFPRIAITLQWLQAVAAMAALFLIINMGGIGLETHNFRAALRDGLVLMMIPILWSTAAASLITKARTLGWWLSLGWDFAALVLAMIGIKSTLQVPGTEGLRFSYAAFLILTIVTVGVLFVPGVRPKQYVLSKARG